MGFAKRGFERKGEFEPRANADAKAGFAANSGNRSPKKLKKLNRATA
jgi:hypothetical protein